MAKDAEDAHFELLWQGWMEKHSTLDMDPELLKIICMGWFSRGLMFRAQQMIDELKAEREEIERR